jgi:hypothetical protein
LRAALCLVDCDPGLEVVHLKRNPKSFHFRLSVSFSVYLSLHPGELLVEVWNGIHQYFYNVSIFFLNRF